MELFFCLMPGTTNTLTSREQLESHVRDNHEDGATPPEILIQEFVFEDQILAPVPEEGAQN